MQSADGSMHGSGSSGVHSDALHCVVRQRIGLRRCRKACILQHQSRVADAAGESADVYGQLPVHHRAVHTAAGDQADADQIRRTGLGRRTVGDHRQ